MTPERAVARVGPAKSSSGRAPSEPALRRTQNATPTESQRHSWPSTLRALYSVSLSAATQPVVGGEDVRLSTPVPRPPSHSIDDAPNDTNRTSQAGSPRVDGRPRDAARAARRLADLIGRVLLKRTQVVQAEQSVWQLHELLLGTSNELVNVLPTARLSGSAEHEQSSRLHRQYQSDMTILKTRQEGLMKLRGELSTLEFRLQNKELMLKEVLKTAEATFSDALWTDDNTVSSSTSGSATHSASQMDPLLARYFDRKGDEGVFRERLQELEYYHAEGLVEREFFADRGETLDISDDGFLDDYHTRREQVLSDLHAAEREAADLAAQCHAAGLNTDITLPPASEGVTAASGSVKAESVLKVTEPWDAVQVPEPSHSTINGESFSGDIESWLDQIISDEA